MVVVVAEVGMELVEFAVDGEMDFIQIVAVNAHGTPGTLSLSLPL